MSDQIKMGTHYTPNTPEEFAEIKVQILYDFCALKKQSRKKLPDPLESKVRDYLLSNKTESAMQAAILPVLLGEKTVTQMLKGGKTA